MITEPAELNYGTYGTRPQNYLSNQICEKMQPEPTELDRESFAFGQTRLRNLQNSKTEQNYLCNAGTGRVKNTLLKKALGPGSLD